MSGSHVVKGRLGVMAVVVVSLFAALFARLYYLQVLTGPEFVAQAEQNQVREIRVQPVRGRVLDRNGVELAANRLIGQVTVDRAVVRSLGDAERDALFGSLGRALAMTGDEVADIYRDPARDQLLPVVVATDVEETTLTYLRERQGDYPGVTAEQAPRRVYPLGPVAAHVVGYVGEIAPDAAAGLADQGYAAGDQIGKTGVERTFETDLRGEAGERRLEVDSGFSVVDVLEEDPARPGDDVVLTLDVRVQQVAERALDDALRAARSSAGDFRTTRPAPAGSVVVLDVTDGSVVAMASAPAFDPNAFVGGIDPELWNVLAAPGSYSPLTNRAVRGLYAPGSTFKPVTAVAGLESGVLDLTTTVYDPGFFVLEPCGGNKCEWQNAGRTPYDVVDLPRSLVVSSDVYYYTIGASIQTDLAAGEDEAIQDVARRIGFGQPTGVQLPGELAGRVPDRALKQELFDEGVFGSGDWSVGDTINLAIGQGEMVATPLQLANAYATLATRGVRHQPNIAARVVDRMDDDTRRELEPRVADPLELEVGDPGAVWDVIHGALAGAVSNPSGTARTAFEGFPLDDYPVAGKTGTAQQFGRNPVTGTRKEDTALFIGYGPADDPRYVVAVVLEEAGYGGSVAAPAARRIFDALHELDRTGDISPPGAGAR